MKSTHKGKPFWYVCVQLLWNLLKSVWTSDSTRSRKEREVKNIDCMMQSILIPLADLGQNNVAPDEDTQNFDKRKTSKEETPLSMKRSCMFLGLLRLLLHPPKLCACKMNEIG